MMTNVCQLIVSASAGYLTGAPILALVAGAAAATTPVAVLATAFAGVAWGWLWLKS